MGPFIHFTLCAGFVLIQGASADYKCQAAGKFSSSESRSKYHECHLVGQNKFTHFEQGCPKDTCFDGVEQTCDPDHCASEHMNIIEGDRPITSTFKCKSPGKFPHEEEWKKGSYYKCIDANGKLYLYEYQCVPTKACFDKTKRACQVC